MQDCIYVVLFHTVQNLRGLGEVAVVEGEVGLRVEDGGVVERGAVVELVEGDDVVVGVSESEVTSHP